MDLVQVPFGVAEGEPVAGGGEAGAEEEVLVGGLQVKEGTEAGGEGTAGPETPAGFRETNRGCHLNIARDAKHQSKGKA